MISVYGKLPVSKEYLRHNCHDALPLRFREWMDRGFDHASQRSLLPSGRDPQRIYYVGPESRSASVAILAPSNDASGTREFPIAVLSEDVGVSDRRFTDLDSAWSRLETLFAELKKEPDTDALFARLREAESVEVAREESAQPVPLHDWIQRLFRFDPVDLFVRALWRVKVLRPHLENPELGHRRVRVPVDRMNPLGPQLDLWHTLLARFHPIFQTTPSLFVPQLASAKRIKPGGAWLIYGEPRAEDFGAALGGEIGESRGVDLVDNEGRLPVEGFSDFRERLEAGPLRSTSDVTDLLHFPL